MLFHQLLHEYSDFDALQRAHPGPALILEVRAEGDQGAVTLLQTPGGEEPPGVEGAGEATQELEWPVRPVSGGIWVGPGARLHWLEKSERNPFAGLIMLGRARNNDVIVQHPTISSMHAIFHVHTEGPWRVEDRSSTNGTSVDGTALKSGQRVILSDGAVLGFGRGVHARFLEARSLWELAMLQGLSQGSPTP